MPTLGLGLGLGLGIGLRNAPGGGATSWTPAELTLTAWYRADTLTDTAGDVTQWTDKSGNANHLIPGTSPSLNATVAAINNQPSVSFVSASSEYLVKAGGAIVAENSHIYVVMQINTSGITDSTILDCQDDNIEALLRIEDVSGNVLSMYSGGVARGTTTFADNTWIVGSFYWDSATSKISLNNEADQTPAVSPGAVSANTGITVGSRATPGTYADMDVAEIIIAPAEITGADKTNLISYLNSRYGFSI